MITGIIIAFLYVLFSVWLAVTVWENYDSISMFNPWKWIRGSSNSAVWAKVIAGLLFVFSALMLEGYLESLEAAL